MHHRLLGFLRSFLLLTTACVPISQQGTPTAGPASPGGAKPVVFADKPLRTDDFVYEDRIRTVMLYPAAGDLDNPAAAALQPAVLPIGQGTPLVLEFDEIGEGSQPFHARLYHCNADWTVSLLTDINFLAEYNDFLLTSYQLSANTKTPYTHYRMEVPKVKLPGNYVLMVHREGNVKDIVLTRRMLVYDNTVDVRAKVTYATGTGERNTNHQLEFTVQYRDYPIANPLEEIKVVLRQNYRPDNAITGLKPMNVRLDEKLLEYNNFNLENNFLAGNEFRFFDTRSILFLGTNVARVNPGPNRSEVLLAADRPRNREAYAQSDDFNGGFVIDHHETRQGATEADYVATVFTLQAPEANGEVYVNGKFNDWQLDERNRMAYSSENGHYTARILLKQGIYNYDYAVVRAGSERREEVYFEGSFFNTENTYEIIAYYRPLGARADRIVGYQVLYHNARR
ncbi:MAG: DUF5103 domain-containing protein [Ferruginibacter sp.]|nr:DUF5103 domain-containing protein [Cytophagales bacterium]